jgi:signal peptidase II
LKKAIFTILFFLILDQSLKIWVKLNFHYGEPYELIPGWFDLQFVENPGMAFGWMLPGQSGKLALSIFRILVVIGISYYLVKLIRQNVHWGYIVCISMIVSGALGNILDSAFYGVWFDRGSTYDEAVGDFTMYFGKAQFGGEGYAPPLMGNVVDMIHFKKTITWGDRTYEIFPPIFNVADSAITLGILFILLFQKRFFASLQPAEESAEKHLAAAPNEEMPPAAPNPTEL